MTPQEYMNQARLLRGKGPSLGKNLDDYQQALSLLREGAGVYPDNYGLHFQFGNYGRDLSRKILNEAAKTLRNVSRNTPNAALRVKALSELGLVEQWLANFRDSEAALRRAIELKPNNEASFTVLATTYKLAGQYAQGIAIVEKALRITPDHPNFLKLAQELKRQEQIIVDSAHIRKLISSDQTLHALNHLEQYFTRINNQDGLNSVSMLQARLSKHEREVHLGLVAKPEGDIVVAQINHAILALLKLV